MNQFEAEVRNAAEALHKGKVILYPTDTIWGLGCDATNARAVERLFRIKRRKDAHSLIALIESSSRLSHYLYEVPPMARPDYFCCKPNQYCLSPRKKHGKKCLCS